MSWTASLYLTFGAHRTRPAADLLAHVPLNEVVRAVDLGCGPGNSTALLAARWPDATLVGVDSSPAMIAAARAEQIKATFALGDFETYTPTPETDLIFANAAFQWSPDPVGLAGRLLAALRPDACLALQVPQNYDQPSHTAIETVTKSARFAALLADIPTYDPGGFARAEAYVRALAPLASTLDVWCTTYWHRLTGPDPVFTWMSATGLRPFLAALADADRLAFSDAMRAAYAGAYPPEADGSTLFPFRRLFVIAGRTA